MLCETKEEEGAFVTFFFTSEFSSMLIYCVSGACPCWQAGLRTTCSGIFLGEGPPSVSLESSPDVSQDMDEHFRRLSHVFCNDSVSPSMTLCRGG